MTGVKRYNLVHDSEYQSQMLVRPDGKYVKYSDYTADVQGLLAALRAVVAIADRDTDEFNAARAAIAKAEGAE